MDETLARSIKDEKVTLFADSALVKEVDRAIQVPLFSGSRCVGVRRLLDRDIGVRTDPKGCRAAWSARSGYVNFGSRLMR